MMPQAAPEFLYSRGMRGARFEWTGLLSWLAWSVPVLVHAEPSVDAYRTQVDAIEQLERNVGVTSPELIEPLLALSNTLVEKQDLGRAIEPLRRAINIVRRSAGLYDLRQQPLLLRAVDLQSQIGDITTSAADLTYLQRVSEIGYGEGTLAYGEALTDVAHWQCRIGQFVQSRASYRQSIEVFERQRATGALVASLRGFANCCLQELAGEGVVTGTDSLDSYRGPIVRTQSFSPGNPAFREHLFRALRVDGEQALERAVELSAPLDPKLRMEVLLQAGDWFLTKDFIREARRLYSQAESLARAGGANDALMSPAQVLYAVPSAALRTRHLDADESEELFVEVEFTVRADGRVVDEKVIDHGPGRSDVQETLGSLRAARFRPRIVEGRSIATEGVRFRQAFRRLK